MRPIDADQLTPDTAWSDYMDAFTAYSEPQIDSAPTLDVTPAVTGEWIEKECYNLHGDEFADYVCSNCFHRISRAKSYTPAYCECCGSLNNKGAKDEID